MLFMPTVPLLSMRAPASHGVKHMNVAAALPIPSGPLTSEKTMSYVHQASFFEFFLQF